MNLSRARAQALVEPSVPSGEALSRVAVAVDPVPVGKMLLLLFGPPAIGVAILAALRIDARAPAATVAMTAVMLALMVPGVLVSLRRPWFVVGITSSRLLVARLADRSGERVAEVQDYPFASLRGTRVRTKLLHLGPAGSTDAFRLELPDATPPLRIAFLPGLMPDNVEACTPILHAVRAAADPSSSAAV